MAKAKASLETARSEIANLTAQVEEAKALAESAAAKPDHSEEVEQLKKQLSQIQDDFDATNEVLALTKQSLSDVSANHSKELEIAATARAEESSKAKAIHDEELTTLAGQNADLVSKLSDAEGEVATLKAALASAETTTKANGAPPPASTGVSQEDLQKMHEAHNLKLHDLQAEHEKVVKVLKDEVEQFQSKSEKLSADLARKAMEIQYLEQEQDETNDQIKQYAFIFDYPSELG